MPRFGFVGPTYTAQSTSASAERAINWYVQLMESDGKSRAILLPSPGIVVFATISDSKVRGGLEYKGRHYVVGQSFYEISSAGVVTNYGALAFDSNPASLVAAGNYVVIASGGSLYTFNVTTNTLAALSDPVGVIQVLTIDGYFVALKSGTNQMRVSAVLDPTSWPGSQIIATNRFPDNIVSIHADHNELVVLGAKSGVFYSDTGSLNIFDPIGGTVIEQGSAATFGAVRIDNSTCFIGQDERGSAVGFRLDGYGPKRITTHAVETAWQGYVRVSDAVSYSYQEQGHTFWHVYFPSATASTSASWRYDTATQLWHEVGYWDAASGVFQAHHSQNHVFCFGKHLVGDWNSGNIYDMSSNYMDDAGNLIRRVRRAPYVGSEEEWVSHYKLQVLLEAGTALQSGQGSNPIINLRWSDDGGHTWSNEHSTSAGLVGQFKARAIWRRLGRSRGRVYEISVSDPIAWRIIDAYLNDSMDGGPVPRLTDQARKAA